MDGLTHWWASVMAHDYYRGFPLAAAALVATFIPARLLAELDAQYIAPRRFWRALSAVLYLACVPSALALFVMGVYGFMDGHWPATVVSLLVLGLVMWALKNWEDVSRLFPRFTRVVEWLYR